jgi:hypothetical protein
LLFRSGDFAVKSPPLSALSTLESLQSMRPSAKRESRDHRNDHFMMAPTTAGSRSIYGFRRAPATLAPPE